jgi:DNA-binding NarL/FixJ family response regulator
MALRVMVKPVVLMVPRSTAIGIEFTVEFERPWSRVTSTVPIRVAIIEDDAPYGEALAAILKGTPGFACAGLYPTAENLLARAEDPADVTVADINLPGLSGIDFVRQFKGKHPDALILMLTVFEDAELIFQSLKAGANGYLLKSTHPAAILEAITEVVAGGAPMSRTIARKVLGYFHAQTPPAPGLPELTDRERDVLARMATGLALKEIADALGLGYETVRTHLRSIYRKLHVHSRAEAVVKYLRQQ